MDKRTVSLRARVTAVVAGLSLGALGLGFGLLALLDARAMRRELVARATARAHLAADYSAAPLAAGDRDAARETLAKLEHITPIQFAALYDARGALFAAYADGAPPPPSIPPPAAEQVRPAPGWIDVLSPIEAGDVRLGTLFLRTSSAPVRATLLGFLATAGAVLLLVGAGAAGLAAPLSAAVTRELEAAHAALARSEARYRSLFESSPAPLLEQDLSAVKAALEELRASGVTDLASYLEGRPAELRRLAGLIRNRDSNDLMREFLGVRSRDELRARIHETFTDAVLETFARSLAFFRAGGRLRECEASIRRLDGEVRDVFYRVLLVPGHEASWDRFLLTFTDITARKRAEEEVRRLAARLEELLANIPDVLWTTDRAGRTSFISPVVERVFGYTAQEVYAGGAGAWHDHIHAEDRGRVLAAFEALFAERRPYDVEYRLRRKDGRWIWLHDRSLHVYEADGVEAADGVFSDVTARKEAEAEVRRLNAELAARLADVTAANKELESFAYSVSHDLRAPLRAIDGFTSVLVDRYAAGLPEEARGMMERMRSRCAQMGELIDSLLALSRLGRHRFVPAEVDLSRLARSATERLRAEDPAREVEFKLARGVKARGDEVLLGAVIENLLGNAWKFTAGVAGARVEFGAEESEGHRRYFVRDNGPGFEMAHARRIFEPFHRLHPEGRFPGTGIGLAIVERVVARHGGKAWAESTPGQGATFYFTLEG